MNRYYLITEQQKTVLPILKELKKVIPFELSETGKAVRVYEDGHGIHISKKAGICTITYEKKNEIARAWFIMYRMEQREEYDVEEQCVFEHLQIMFDCSRNAVMNVTTLKEYITLLALMGYHSLQLYTEDTIQVDNEPYFGYMRGAYTKAEIKEIDTYCQIFGVELIPCIQTLAHISQITRYERYDKIIDVNDILLVGDEKTYEFLEHLIASAADAFTSRNINIGMDEAHMLGLGKFLDKHGYQERFLIMIKHLSRVQEILKKYGFTPMMWSDMFFRLLANGAYHLEENQINQELFDLIPKDITLIYWDYYSMDYNHYNDNLKMHYQLSKKISFAAGAWKWTGFAPENGYSLKAGEQAMRACIDTKVKDFIVTCWGDNGAESSVFSILPSLFYYAEASYDTKRLCYADEQADIENEKDNNFCALTGLSFQDFMKIDGPNQVFGIKEHVHSNVCKYLLYNDVLIGTFDSLVSKEIINQYEIKAVQLRKLSEIDNRYHYLFHTMALLCEVLCLKADLGKKIYQAYQKKDLQQIDQLSNETIPEVLRRLNQFQAAFRFQWHKENKSFGFEIQLIRLGGLKERILYTREQLIHWMEGGIKQIEELEGVRLPFAYFEEADSSKINYNLWNSIVSPSVLG